MTHIHIKVSNAVATALAFLHTQPAGAVIRVPLSARDRMNPPLSTFCEANGLGHEIEGAQIKLWVK